MDTRSGHPVGRGRVIAIYSILELIAVYAVIQLHGAWAYGTIQARRGSVSVAENPVSFWLSVAIQGIYLAVLAVHLWRGRSKSSGDR